MATVDKKYKDMTKIDFEEHLAERFENLRYHFRKSSSNLSMGAEFKNCDYYYFDHQHRGLAVIIINENFNHPNFENILGYHQDEIALKKSFAGLGFHVEPFEDLTAWQMKLVAQAAAAQYRHQDADCFVCAILTHGREWIQDGKDKTSINVHLLSGVDGYNVKTKEIVDCFNDTNCPSLIGKPRMFFIQACRGKKLDDGVKVQDFGNGELVGGEDGAAMPMLSEPGRSGHKGTFRPVILYPDCLIMYSSPPGFWSFVNRESGSWFIQELCKVLDCKDIGSKSFLRDLVTVCGKVALHYESKTYNPHEEYVKTLSQNELEERKKRHGKKCTPVVTYQLLKDLYMTKHKKCS